MRRRIISWICVSPALTDRDGRLRRRLILERCYGDARFGRHVTRWRLDRELVDGRLGGTPWRGCLDIRDGRIVEDVERGIERGPDGRSVEVVVEVIFF